MGRRGRGGKGGEKKSRSFASLGMTAGGGEVKGVFPFTPTPKFSFVQRLYAVDANKADSSRG